MFAQLCCSNFPKTNSSWRWIYSNLKVEWAYEKNLKAFLLFSWLTTVPENTFVDLKHFGILGAEWKWNRSFECESFQRFGKSRAVTNRTITKWNKSKAFGAFGVSGCLFAVWRSPLQILCRRWGTWKKYSLVRQFWMSLHFDYITKPATWLQLLQQVA